MKKVKVTIAILVMVFVGLTTMSCKDNKKEHDYSDEHNTEMTNHDNSDGHHDEEATHDNSDGHSHEADNASSANRDIQASIQKNGATSAIIDNYLQIKNALVSDNKDAAAKGATMMLTAFSNFDMSHLSEAQHKEYMEIVESGKEQAEHIVENPIDHQREHFETLSTDIIDLITLLGTNKTLYLDYCPMKKVSWLSETKAIKNPFYGSEMITCGNVKKQIN